MNFNQRLAIRAAGRNLKETQEFLNSEYPGYTIDESRQIHDMDGKYVTTLVYPVPSDSNQPVEFMRMVSLGENR